MYLSLTRSSVCRRNRLCKVTKHSGFYYIEVNPPPKKNPQKQAILLSYLLHCCNYVFSDLDDGLDHNYCRNPGDGTSPWCYVHRDNCGRNYCDPCGLGMYVIYTQCRPCFLSYS